MKHSFVREYAPAYDYFLTIYFQKAGIPFDENTTFEVAEEIASQIKKKGYDLTNAAEQAHRPLAFIDALTAPDALFWRYVYYWGEHPESRPAVYKLLKFAVGGPEFPELGQMRDLESRMIARGGTLVISEAEAGKEISDFYKRQVANPLRNDLNGGASAEDIVGFLSLEELRQVPDPAVGGVERFEKETRRVAGELLAWLDTITPAGMAADTKALLEEHDEDPGHMRQVLDKQGETPQRLSVCEHVSKCVTLAGVRGSGEKRTGLLLSPTRGYHVSDIIADEGVNDLIFPRYWVL